MGVGEEVAHNFFSSLNTTPNFPNIPSYPAYPNLQPCQRGPTSTARATGPREKRLAQVQRLSVPPHARVDSGNGYHATPRLQGEEVAMLRMLRMLRGYGGLEKKLVRLYLSA